jgi:predicted lipoprotein with Yx(FWY)xxD motif
VNRKTFAIGAMALLAVVAIAIAGCGGSDDSSSGGSSYGGGDKPASESSGGQGGPAAVSLGNVQGLGMVLVDSDGMTLYDFHKDKGTTSSCYGACAQAWPPLLTEGEPAADGADGSKLGTSERKDGTTQVTYAGHPLYTFVEDAKPGEANGNDVSAFGAEWYALTGSGEEPED